MKICLIFVYLKLRILWIQPSNCFLNADWTKLAWKCFFSLSCHRHLCLRTVSRCMCSCCGTMSTYTRSPQSPSISFGGTSVSTALALWNVFVFFSIVTFLETTNENVHIFINVINSVEKPHKWIANRLLHVWHWMWVSLSCSAKKGHSSPHWPPGDSDSTEQHCTQHSDERCLRPHQHAPQGDQETPRS